MSSVALDGKDGKEIKFYKVGPIFSSSTAMTPKIDKKKIWLLLLHKNCLIASSKLYTRAFCVWVKALNNDFSTELTSNSNILMEWSL